MNAPNPRQVRESVDRAAQCAGRPGGVTLLAVSKTRSADEVAALADQGFRHFGENYLQEAAVKIEALTRRRLTWHFIGAIQSNKTRDIARWFDWVHTVDRVKVARRLDEAAREYSKNVDVCIQVNIDEEPQKAGVAPGELIPLVRDIAHYRHLRLRGLMVIPKAHEGDAGARVRQRFCETRELFEDCAVHVGATWDTLSMGMSADFETAIEEGATIVRIGTALFGPRIN